MREEEWDNIHTTHTTHTHTHTTQHTQAFIKNYIQNKPFETLGWENVPITSEMSLSSSFKVYCGDLQLQNEGPRVTMDRFAFSPMY